jgi:hypothetical protein
MGFNEKRFSRKTHYIHFCGYLPPLSRYTIFFILPVVFPPPPSLLRLHITVLFPELHFLFTYVAYIFVLWPSGMHLVQHHFVA